MKKGSVQKRKDSPSPFVVGDYTGIHDKKGRRVKVGDVVKITIGKPNNGYLVIFEAGAFCFTGGAVGTCSFIKFRDELISGNITGVPIHESFESFLEIVSNKPDAIAPVVPMGSGSNYHQPKGSGGTR